MLHLDEEGFRIGLNRAQDLFRLQRLHGIVEAEALAMTVFANFGIDEEKRRRLIETLIAMLPVKGDPLAESVMTCSMFAGVLIGLMIADAAVPTHPDVRIPDHPPADL